MNEQQDETPNRDLHLSLETVDAGEPISGRLERPDGATVRFSGWLGLVAAIEEAAARSADPGLQEGRR